MRLRLATIGLVLAVGTFLGTIEPALPAGGGGGGGGGFSGSAPAYDPAADYQKGVAAYQAANFKAAIAAFRKVVAAVPGFAPAQYLLGSSYLQQGDFKSAKRPLEQAVKGDATMIDAHRDLAITYAKLNDTAKATGQRDALVTMKTSCAGTCPTSAQLDAAIQAVDMALAGQPLALAPSRRPGALASAEASYVEAVSLINEHRYEAAIGELERAVWSRGPDPDFLTYLGFANRKLKRYDSARLWYEEALAIDPQHRGALEYYGELKLELGDVAGARQHLARLDALCGFGCQQADELRRWLRESARSAS